MRLSPAAAFRRFLLALLVALGILGMHGTAAMADPMLAGQTMTGPTMAPCSQPASMTMTPPVPAAEQPPPAPPDPTSPAAVPAPAGGRSLPGEHHMVAPCLATVPPQGVVTAAPVQVVAPDRRPAVPSIVASAGHRCERPADPPDLDRLGISRT